MKFFATGVCDYGSPEWSPCLPNFLRSGDDAWKLEVGLGPKKVADESSKGAAEFLIGIWNSILGFTL